MARWYCDQLATDESTDSQSTEIWEMKIALYHGTTPEGAAGIRADGYIRGGDLIFGTSERGVSLTSKRSVAEDYGEVVVCVWVDTKRLRVDPESNDNGSIDEALRTGAAVYVIGDVAV